jgi:phosphocarrier protein
VSTRSQQQHEQVVTIVNELGMHARAATRFVQLANKHQSEVEVEKDGQWVNGKSIMGVLMLVASKGSQIRIRATGPDAPGAVRALVELVEGGFGEMGRGGG